MTTTAASAGLRDAKWQQLDLAALTPCTLISRATIDSIDPTLGACVPYSIDCSGANVRWPGTSGDGLQLCIRSTADSSTTVDDLKSRVEGGDAIEVPGVGLYAEAADRHAVALFDQRVVDIYFGGDNIPVTTTRAQFAALLQEIVTHLEAL